MAKKHKINNNLIYAIVMLILGILLIVGGAGFAQNALGILITVLGAVLVVYGILDLVAKNFANGVIYLLFGILLIVFAWTIAWVAFVVLGAVLLLAGIINIVHDKKKNLVKNILSLVLGVLALLLAFGVHGAWAFVNIIFYILGGLCILEGLVVLLYAMKR
ncbi:MAG: DUF308 domain-containing protein [Candidatus Enteromonas sp.]|nr:DUF308 domain-containing protein [Candidatus Enteromonas sp.]